MLMRDRKKPLVALVATLGLLAGGTTWAATNGDGGAALQPDGTMAGGGPTIAVSFVPSDILANFALFRDQPPSPIPADAAAQVGSAGRFGRNPNLARAINTVTGTGWVIPGNGWLCIVVPDPVDGFGTSCEPTSAAIEQGLVLSMWGNLPNGKVAETLLVADGQRAVVGGQGVPTNEGVASVFTDAPGTLDRAS